MAPHAGEELLAAREERLAAPEPTARHISSATMPRGEATESESPAHPHLDRRRAPPQVAEDLMEQT